MNKDTHKITPFLPGANCPAAEPHFYECKTAREILRFVARFFFKGARLAIEDWVEDMLEL